MITKENIEAYLLDLIEGNLNPDEVKELEAFLKDNPQFRDMIDGYDSSLVLMVDKNIKFEDKESLRRKNKVKAFYPYIKYSFVAVAACFILFIFVSKLFIKPLDNTTNNNFDTVLVQNTNSTPSISPSTSVKNDKEEIGNTKTTISPKNTMTIAKAEKPQEKEIQKEVEEEIKPEPKILLSNSMVVYEVDNLIAYIKEEEIKENRIIEVDNLVAYNDSPTTNPLLINPLLNPLINNKYVDQLRYNLESKIEKTQNGFNNALIYIQENVKFNQLELVLAKK
ncbi:MAG: hypothetical protein VB011_00455 [Bacteroidales bacterium]|nr:hypothetical protein [Bacteroidales bacterium]